MIVLNKSVCTGCSACYSICPVHCISMKEDAEGFLYPFCDEEKCILCKRCESVCPAIIQRNERKPLQVYAVKNPNEEIRLKSSSGGMFTLLAEHIIKEGGVVFGARFNDAWEVVHDYTEKIEGLAVFRGSKYVQSNIGDTYTTTEFFLKAGKKVLFSGTPCQIAGLKAFLQKEYDNLLTVDFVCHGVPSPLVWKKYLEELMEILPPPPNEKNAIITDIKFRDKTYGHKMYSFFISMYMKNNINITDINFRDKKYSWKQKHFTITSIGTDGKTFSVTEPKTKNVFQKGFLENLYLRLSCYTCQVKSFRSGNDITIADCWGIQNILPEFDDDKGVSLVMVNTEKGKEVYESLNKIEQKITYNEALASNSMIEKSVSLPSKRAVFFEKWRGEPIIPLINKLAAPSLNVRIRKTIVVFLRKLGLLSILKSILKK